ncbi:VOC family protein [Leptospira haakeii]|uniref:Glyoxalase-like domain protein n=1 Tax=Leptospira haakeii TaxID=2023198 RepID=A0ABX4PGC6_9LEPT|nr:VOC family protein [Leptospira haakeii]PKA14688.1 glyoxalase-like domain protein [Leptospira haakeii]PKA19066.1 glyoxalase-like domain protein [Leptospira haakeii]
MKKFLIVLFSVLFLIIIWWILTPSPHEYKRITNSDLSFETVIFRSSDPKRLSNFYKNVFQAKEAENDSSWSLSDPLSSIITLRTPDYQGEGPLFTILKTEKKNLDTFAANDLGYAHICFETDNVPGLIQTIQNNGGKIDSRFEDLQKVPAIYGRDPDGNIFEVHIPFPTPLSPSTIFRSLNSFVRTYFKLDPPAVDKIRFLHVNINSKDWIRTLSFYGKIFETNATGFERDYKGNFIENLTGLTEIEVKGRHLPLPGYEEGGPTFEIFSYNKFSKIGPLDKSDTGRIAVGFRVSDLRSSVKKILEEGGVLLEEKDNTTIFKDPEGNLILVSQKNLASKKPIHEN